MSGLLEIKGIQLIRRCYRDSRVWQERLTNSLIPLLRHLSSLFHLSTSILLVEVPLNLLLRRRQCRQRQVLLAETTTGTIQCHAHILKDSIVTATQRWQTWWRHSFRISVRIWDASCSVLRVCNSSKKRLQRYLNAKRCNWPTAVGTLVHLHLLSRRSSPLERTLKINFTSNQVETLTAY